VSGRLRRGGRRRAQAAWMERKRFPPPPYDDEKRKVRSLSLSCSKWCERVPALWGGPGLGKREGETLKTTTSTHKTRYPPTPYNKPRSRPFPAHRLRHGQLPGPRGARHLLLPLRPLALGRCPDALLPVGGGAQQVPLPKQSLRPRTSQGPRPRTTTGVSH